jgi:hypothetical protein
MPVACLGQWPMSATHEVLRRWLTSKGGNGRPMACPDELGRPPVPLCVVIGTAQIAARGGADRRSAKNADRPMHQSREAHLAAWPLHSP